MLVFALNLDGEEFVWPDPFNAGLLGWEDDAPLAGWEDLAPLNGWQTVGVSSGIDPVGGPLGGPVAERVYAISATFFPNWNDQSASSGDVPYAIADLPIAGLPFEEDDDEAPLISGYSFRVSSRDFSTLIDDPDLPSVSWEGRIIDPGSISRSMPLVPEEGSAIETSIGSVVVDNTDGLYDTILDSNAAVSQALEIKGGRLADGGRYPISYMEEFVSLFIGRVTGIGTTQDELTLDLQDPVVYAQNVFPTTVYLGTGAAEGDSELAGTMKPVVLGHVWNMSPTLVDPTNLVFQVHDGAVDAIPFVYDGGVSLPFSADYANYAALVGATIASGHHATCLALGLFRLASTPVYAISCHANGLDSAGVYISTIAAYLVGLLESQVGLSIDSDSFDDLPDVAAGWVWTEEFTLEEALSRFVGDAGFYWGSDTTGVIRAFQLDEPDQDDLFASYADYDITELSRVAMPDGYGGVHHRRQVRYQKNWTVQSDSELAATASERTFRQREWKTAAATVSVSTRNAIDPPILDTSLSLEAPALDLATHLLDLHGVPRRMLSAEVSISSGIPALGSTVKVTYPRFGLSGGEAFRVVAVDLRLATSTLNLLLWG